MNDWQARRAVHVLRHGGLVLHATEGVWGLACDPWNPAAVQQLLACKARGGDKGLILIGAHSRCFDPELGALEDSQRSTVRDSWPGAVTWVLPNRRFPRWITGGRATVAVRVPGHRQARALAGAFGAPLVSTSANRAGRPPARRYLQARRFASELRRRGPGHPQLYLLPGETLGRRFPSSIRIPGGATLRQGA